MRKIVSLLLLTCLVLSVCVHTSATDITGEDVVYKKGGFKEPELAAIADDSIIIREDSIKFYNNNLEDKLFQDNVEATPYFEGDTLYAPVIPLLRALGYDTDQNGETITAEKDGKKLSLGVDKGDVKVKVRCSELFAPIHEFAKAVNVHLFQSDSVAIMSYELKLDHITDDMVKRFEEGLEFVWDNVYMGSLGYVTGMIAHPTNNKLVYARTDVGGMYRFDYDSEKWIQLMDCIPYEKKGLVNVRSIGFDPRDDKIIYAACGDTFVSMASDVLKSYDRGESWHSTNFPAQLDGGSHFTRVASDALAVDPINPDVVYCGSSFEGTYVSADAGESWSRIESIPNGEGTVPGGVGFVYIDPDSTKAENGRSSTVYVGVWNYGIYKSSDGGESFSLMPGSPMLPMRMERSRDRLYVSEFYMADSGHGNGGFFKYEDGEWINITPSEKGYYSIGGFMIDKNNPDTILVTGAPWRSNNFYRSYDGGNSWTYMGSFADLSDIIQDPNNPNGIWMPFGAGIYYVDDFHADEYKVRRRDYGVEELVVEKMISLPDPKAPVAIIQVMDHGQKVQERFDELVDKSVPAINNGSGIDFCEEDPRYILRTGQNGGQKTGSAAVSQDYGRTFAEVNWDTNLRIMDCAVGATKQENGYPIIMTMSIGKGNGVGEGRGIYRSLDNGATWEKLDVPVARNQPYYFQIHLMGSDRVDGNTFYYSEGSNLYVTRNGGKSWKRAHSFEKASDYDGLKTIPGIEGGIWYLNSGTMYASYDFGETFTLVDTLEFVGKGFSFGIGKGSDNIPAVYATGYKDGIFGMYLSDDLGGSWRRISTDANTFVPNIVDVCGDRRVYGRVIVATGGRGAMYGQHISIDDIAPAIKTDMESSVDEICPEYAVNTKNFHITGSVSEIAEVHINGVTVETDGYNRFHYPVELKEGENTFLIEAKDEVGNFAVPKELMIRYQPDFLGIEYQSETKISTKEETVKITGRTAVPATIHYGNHTVRTASDNSFEFVCSVKENAKLPVYAVDDTGVKSETTVFELNYDTQLPELNLDTIPDSLSHRYYLVKGRLNEAGEVMVNGSIIKTADDFSFSIPVMLEQGENTIKVQARDKAKNTIAPVEFKTAFNLGDTSKLQAFRKSDKLVLDGDVSEWKLDYHMDKLFYGKTDNDAQFGVMWDEEYLYIAADITDPVIYTGHESVYDNDAMEVYLDGDNAKSGKYDENDAQLAFAPDTRYVDGVNSFYKITDKGYSLEVRIPWSRIHTIPEVNKKIGFDIDIVDNDGLDPNEESARSGAIGFNGTMEDWNNTSVFATMTLVDSVGE